MSRKKHGLNQRLAIAQSNTELLKALVRIVEEEGGTDDDLMAVLSDTPNGMRLRAQLGRLLVNNGAFAALDVSQLSLVVNAPHGSFAECLSSAAFAHTTILLSDDECEMLWMQGGGLYKRAMRLKPFRMRDLHMRGKSQAAFSSAVCEYAASGGENRVAEFWYYLEFLRLYKDVLLQWSVIYPHPKYSIWAYMVRQGEYGLRMTEPMGMYSDNMQLACLVYA